MTPEQIDALRALFTDERLGGSLLETQRSAVADTCGCGVDDHQNRLHDVVVDVGPVLEALPELLDTIEQQAATIARFEALAREYRPTMHPDVVHAWGADVAALAGGDQ